MSLYRDSHTPHITLHVCNPLGKPFCSQQDALTQAFGSVRKQHAAESRRKSRVGTEALDKSAKTAVKLAKSQPSTPISK